MNKARHHNLPSISTLLSSPSSPPRIVVVAEQQEQQEQQQQSNNLLSPRYLKSPSDQQAYNDRLSVTLSPMLSPIDSYASSVNSLSPNTNSFQPPSPLPSPSMLSLPPNHALPPLQGDDPPRRLQRHPSISSLTSNSTSPKPSYNSLWTSTSTSTPTSPNPHHQYTTFTSNNHRSPSPSPSVSSLSPKAMSVDDPTNPSRSSSPAASTVERPPLPPSTQIILSESGQPILKRRRGRPPSMREPSLEGGWTFLTPTVWDVKQDQTQTNSQNTNHTTHTSTISLTSTTSADSVMNGSMAAFTSSNMDMVLQMPRKKRGRKPKTHIVGNSCFVWKDITASRRSTKVIKEQQQQQQQKAALRRLEQASTSSSDSV